VFHADATTQANTMQGTTYPRAHGLNLGLSR
jgi:hypothetical protein